MHPNVRNSNKSNKWMFNFTKRNSSTFIWRRAYKIVLSPTLLPCKLYICTEPNGCILFSNFHMNNNNIYSWSTMETVRQLLHSFTILVISFFTSYPFVAHRLSVDVHLLNCVYNFKMRSLVTGEKTRQSVLQNI
jgi:hypothetical protein